ncbi:hypothetical protein SAMN05216311_1021, partial [Chitinophaga sp. CF418]
GAYRRFVSRFIDGPGLSPRATNTVAPDGAYRHFVSRFIAIQQNTIGLRQESRVCSPGLQTPGTCDIPPGPCDNRGTRNVQHGHIHKYAGMRNTRNVQHGDIRKYADTGNTRNVRHNDPLSIQHDNKKYPLWNLLPPASISMKALSVIYSYTL